MVLIQKRERYRTQFVNAPFFGSVGGRHLMYGFWQVVNRLLIGQRGSPESNEIQTPNRLKPPVPWANQSPITCHPMGLQATVSTSMVRI